MSKHDLDGGTSRLEVLDGLRAASILMVLACHMLPLGRRFGVNDLMAPLAMAIFFTLSGFLITQTLLRSPAAVPFLIRRFARIVPLAWLATIFYMQLLQKSLDYYVNIMLFTINYNTQYRTYLTSTFWSLCVEVHFYLGVAAIVLLFGRRGLLSLPLLALAITALRIYDGARLSIRTHDRVDEILAGATLALIWAGELGSLGRTIKRWLNCRWGWIAVLFVASCHPASGPLMYARPYLAAALVGSLLYSSGQTRKILTSPAARYIAEISYALYITHSFMWYGWLDSGGKWTVLAKRPIGFALIFAVAHLSTFYFEAPFIAFGKHLSRRWERWRNGGATRLPEILKSEQPTASNFMRY